MYAYAELGTKKEKKSDHNVHNQPNAMQLKSAPFWECMGKENDHVYSDGKTIQFCKMCENCQKTLWACECENYEEGDDTGDPDYNENTGSQYLSAKKLRANLKAEGQHGEAHHILPGNVVQGMPLGQFKEPFNEAWNGIMLDGSIDAYGKPIHAYISKAPAVLHRWKNQPCHDRYDASVEGFLESKGLRNTKDIADCKDAAQEIKNKIRSSTKKSLDDLTF